MTDSDAIPAQFASMKQAAGALGMPYATIQWAKKKGCDAITPQGRVLTRKLLAWLFKRDEEEGDVNWADRLNEYKAKREEIRLAKDKGESLDKDEVKFAIGKAMSRLASLMDRKFKLEAPPALKGLDERAIQTWLESATTAFFEEVKAGLGEVGKE